MAALLGFERTHDAIVETKESTMPEPRRLILPATVAALTLALAAACGAHDGDQPSRAVGEQSATPQSSPRPSVDPEPAPAASADPGSILPPEQIDPADAVAAREFAETVVAAAAEVTTMRQVLSFSGNLYEAREGPIGQVELHISPGEVLACTSVDMSVRCSETTPDGLGAETALLYEYGAHGTADLGGPAAAYAGAALTFMEVTDADDGTLLQAGQTSYHMWIDPAEVDAARVGFDPGVLASAELMSAMYILDESGLPVVWAVTMTAGSGRATVATAVHDVNEPSEITELLAVLDRLDGS